MASDPVAQAYAQALFSIAEVEGAIDKVENELTALRRILGSNFELKGFLDDLSIETEGKTKALTELFEGKLSPITFNLVCTAVSLGKQHSLAAVAEIFSGLASRHRGQVTVEVVTAVDLTEEMAQKLKQALAKLLKKQIYLVETKDPSILGGCVVKVGDQIIDGCLRTRLQRLRASLMDTL